MQMIASAGSGTRFLSRQALLDPTHNQVKVPIPVLDILDQAVVGILKIL